MSEKLRYYHFGGKMPSYQGYRRYQRGYGFFSQLFSFAMLLIKKALPVIGKEAVKSGWDLAKDAMEGNENFRTAAKKGLNKAPPI